MAEHLCDVHGQRIQGQGGRDAFLMRSRRGLLLSMGISSMQAADPFAGTWKQNKQMGGGALYVPSETSVVKNDRAH